MQRRARTTFVAWNKGSNQCTEMYTCEICPGMWSGTKIAFMLITTLLETAEATGTFTLRTYDVCTVPVTVTACLESLINFAVLLRHLATSDCWKRCGTSIISSGIIITCTFCTGTVSKCVSVLPKNVAAIVSTFTLSALAQATKILCHNLHSFSQASTAPRCQPAVIRLH